MHLVGSVRLCLSIRLCVCICYQGAYNWQLCECGQPAFNCQFVFVSIQSGLMAKSCIEVKGQGQMSGVDIRRLDCQVQQRQFLAHLCICTVG